VSADVKTGHAGQRSYDRTHDLLGLEVLVALEVFGFARALGSHAMFGVAVLEE